MTSPDPALAEAIERHSPTGQPSALRRNRYSCTCGGTWSPEHVAAVITTDWLRAHDARVEVAEHDRIIRVLQIWSQAAQDRHRPLAAKDGAT